MSYRKVKTFTQKGKNCSVKIIILSVMLAPSMFHGCPEKGWGYKTRIIAGVNRFYTSRTNLHNKFLKGQ